MARMTVAICDEVRKDAQRLYKELSVLIPEADLRLYRTRESLLNALRKELPVFHMIFMGLDGEYGKSLETVRAMRMNGNYVPVVLVAENEKFYKEAFEVFAYNYLTKPVDTGELEHVLAPVLADCAHRKGEALHFQYRTRIYTLPLERLEYISSSLHNITFHLVDGKKLSCRAHMGDFEDQLNGSSFLRCHQSFYVNLEKVTALKKNSFVMKDTEIPISRAYLKTARQKYKDYLESRKVGS